MAICPMHAMGGWMLPTLFHILIFGSFFLIVWWLIKQSSSPKENAKQILDKRLAKGEITKKQYHELKKEIE